MSATSLLFVSALNDSGGAYLARMLDGHPALAVFPFETQLGTGVAADSLDARFPAKYRWPVLPADARRAFDAFANEELRRAGTAPDRGKFVSFPVDVDVVAWRATFEARIGPAASTGDVVTAWLETFFPAWRDRRTSSTAAPRYLVGHCPVLALDWEIAAADLPEARMLHVVRDPLAGYVDTRRRRPDLSPDEYGLQWSLLGTLAHVHAARRPDRFRVVRYADLLADVSTAMREIAGWLEIDPDELDLAPTWDGAPLHEMGPFGGIPTISGAHDEANVASLDPAMREVLLRATAGARVLLGMPMPDDEPDAASREDFLAPADTITIAAVAAKRVPVPLDHETDGDFWGLLDELGVALLVTREYEHLLVLLGGDGGRPWQSAMVVPHPSGASLDRRDGAFVVSSTRNPNQLLWFRRAAPDDWQREIVPSTLERDERTWYLPVRSRVLPGSLYLHDVVHDGENLFATVTGHNFVARLDLFDGWERVWWPRVIDDLDDRAFGENCLQLNSIGLGAHGLADAYLTAFSDQISGPKPWKEGYGPEGRGVLFDAESREVMLRGLTCPHSARVDSERVWVCDSGFGVLGTVDAADGASGDRTLTRVATLPGFTRGLAFAGGHAIVGLSRIIERYEPYAPGVDAAASRCGVALVDAGSGSVVASLWWPHGAQVYDVQVLPGVTRPSLPHGRGPDGSAELRSLG